MRQKRQKKTPLPPVIGCRSEASVRLAETSDKESLLYAGDE